MLPHSNFQASGQFFMKSLLQLTSFHCHSTHVNIMDIYGELCSKFHPFNIGDEEESVCLQWRTLAWQHHKKAVFLFYFICFYHFRYFFLGFVISSFIFPSLLFCLTHNFLSCLFFFFTSSKTVHFASVLLISACTFLHLLPFLFPSCLYQPTMTVVHTVQGMSLVLL